MDSAASHNNNPGTIQGVCPTDWHLPSLSEWEELASYVDDNNGNVFNGSEIGGSLLRFIGGDPDANISDELNIVFNMLTKKIKKGWRLPSLFYISPVSRPANSSFGFTIILYT